VPTFFGGALSLGFFVFRQKTQGGAVRTLPVFLDFLILFLGGNARHFLRAFSVGFCLWFARMPTRRDICHHFVSFGAIFVNVCVFFVACFSFFGAHGTLPGHFSHKLAHFSSAWGRKATM